MSKSLIAIIGQLGKNILGTADINMKIPGMRKEQDFCVYPMQKGSAWENIQIQSSTRIGVLNLLTGKGEMSASHQNGAYFHTFQLDRMKKKTVAFEVSEADLTKIKEHIKTTSGASVGNMGVSCDNTEASMTSL